MTFRLMCVAILIIAAHLLPTDAAVRVWGLRAFNLDGDPIGPPDPYVKVSCGSTFSGMTDFRQDNANPTWSDEFNFPKCKAKDILKLEVWDKDLIYDDQLGTCTLKVQSGTQLKLDCIVGRGSLSFSYLLK
ncbi:BAG-associated GRAM protein 1-like [Colossoma macropomum]|uniref:BAG-associated GRAM protein 1-like n=1 Tax=Colossoma macropomum TaxID=42526 RepID=UPI001865566A|nr:BAG-associated GRAM protein 1-like [Colossoma macropomum]